MLNNDMIACDTENRAQNLVPGSVWDGTSEIDSKCEARHDLPLALLTPH